MNLDHKHLVMLRMIGSDDKPSLGDMAKETGLARPTVQNRVAALAGNGYIVKTHGAVRSLALTDAGKEALTEKAG